MEMRFTPTEGGFKQSNEADKDINKTVQKQKIWEGAWRIVLISTMTEAWCTPYFMKHFTWIYTFSPNVELKKVNFKFELS